MGSNPILPAITPLKKDTIRLGPLSRCVARSDSGLEIQAALLLIEGAPEPQDKSWWIGPAMTQF